MKAQKTLANIPYLLLVAALPLIVFSCITFIGGRALLKTDVWWILLAVPPLGSLAGFVIGLMQLREKGAAILSNRERVR
jgi:hypothetical protein